MKTIEITKIYKLLNTAKLTKMEDSDKLKVIKILRSIRATAKGYEDFAGQVYEKIQGDDHKAMTDRADKWNKSHKGMKASDLSQAELEELESINGYFTSYNNRVEACLMEEAEKETEPTLDKISEDAFCKLVSSNDWTCEQIMLLSDNIVV